MGFLFPEPVRWEIEARQRRLFLEHISEDKTVKPLDGKPEEKEEKQEMDREEKEKPQNEKMDMEENEIPQNVEKETHGLWYSVEYIRKIVQLFFSFRVFKANIYSK